MTNFEIVLAIGAAGNLWGGLHWFYCASRKRAPDKIRFRIRDLIMGRRTLAETSRIQLLIEGTFMLLMSIGGFTYLVLRWCGYVEPLATPEPKEQCFTSQVGVEIPQILHPRWRK